jgi:dihydroorotate dehydrogenase electron transfer subunit
LSEMPKIKPKIFLQKAKIIANQNIADKYYKITIDSKKISRKAQPGEFINLRITNAYQPLLRKPFSIHRIKGSKIQLLYEVVGQGTRILSRKKSGEYLDTLGPLGKGFDCSLARLKSSVPILVAGGIGVAPLLYLADKIVKLKPLVLIGARTRKQILSKNDFKNIGCSVKISTDDGSLGYRGKVTDLLRQVLQSQDLKKKALIYACGPEPMRKVISEIAKRYNIPAEVSLESYMACGFGVCLGCTVNTRSGYRLVCKDGPVFDARKIR